MRLYQFLSVACFLSIPLFSNAQDSKQLHVPLSYAESSTGLGTPAWEGGRTELELADIDQDGRLDIITVGDHGNPFINTDEHGIMVYFGNGEGQWTVHMTGDFGYGGIAVGDVNNDGHPDVGYGIHHNYSSSDLGDQILEVALGDGTGTAWTPWDDNLATAGEDWGMFSSDFADVDNDGDLDLGSISFGCCAGIHVYLNDMDGSWDHSFGILEGNSDMIFEFGDVNNDGFMDLAAGYQFGTVYFGNGTGNFTLMDLNLPSAGSLGRPGPSLGDVDNDGGEDLAFINASGGPEVWIWQEDIEEWSDFSNGLPASGDFEMTQLADLDMDGNVDLAAFGNALFTAWLGDGKGNWSDATSFSTQNPGNAQAFRVGGDADHNGKPDLALLVEIGAWPNEKNYLKFFRETSPVFLLTIRPVFPRGHEIFWQNCIRNIEWTTAVPGDETGEVKLEYSVSGDQGPWYLIAENLPDNGSYQWLIPPENSLDCFLRYTVTTETSSHATTTPYPFTITNGTASTPGFSRSESHRLLVSPNPFRDKVRISCQLPAEMKAMLYVSDMQGRLLTTLAESVMASGINTVTWNGRLEDGSSASRGVYFITLETPSGQRTKKLLKVE